MIDSVYALVNHVSINECQLFNISRHFHILFYGGQTVLLTTAFDPLSIGESFMRQFTKSLGLTKTGLTKTSLTNMGLILAALVLSLAASPALADGVSLLVEMEDAVSAAAPEPTAKDAKPPQWTAAPLEGASGGKVLHASQRSREGSPAVQVNIATPGHYRLWVRYYRDKAVSPGFIMIVRDDSGLILAFRYLDFAPVMPTDTPYKPFASWAGDKTGFIWEPFDVTINHPMRVSLSMAGTRTGTPRDKGYVDRQLDCVLFTTDTKLDPEKLDAKALAQLASQKPQALTAPPAPKGFVWATGLPDHTDAYAGLPAHVHGKAHTDNTPIRFEAGLVNNGHQFTDDTAAVRLGFNHDHAYATDNSVSHGIATHGVIEGYRMVSREVQKEYPSPQGRFVNAQGKAGKTFSFHFKPAIESSQEMLSERLKGYLDRPNSDAIAAWRTSVEDGGFLDYSTDSLAAFREWLSKKHGDIATLNKRWHTNYPSFDDITPPATFDEGQSAWFEFRDFNGESYTNAVARQMPIVAKEDPLNRPTFAAASSLDMFAPYFTQRRPVDFDQLMSVAYKDQPTVSWDTYCADDQLACETELMYAFGDGRKPVIQEWSNHAVDARLAARSYWSVVGKGVSGVFLFMFLEGRTHATYPKWALMSHEGVPKPKLAAYSDAVQEVHRIEPLLMSGKYTHAVKPIALYWSRLDLSVAEPSQSLYGTTLNSPIHVYATLRGLGYPVRWITPRQVRNGVLDEVSAVFLVGSNHMPADVASTIEKWVHQGGVIVGDELPASRDEYAQPQDTLAGIFGVQVFQNKRTGKGASDLAVQESTQGYGEVTDQAVVRKEPYTMVEEIAQQPGATHAVAKEIGDYMLSGIGPRRMVCTAGHVVGMTHRGNAGLVINEYGKGKSLYSTIMLGTLYESGGTGFEWNSGHSGQAYARTLKAFLSWAGVPLSSQAKGAPAAVLAKLRIESPVVSKQGNVIYGMTSYNDAPVGPLEITVELPKNAQGPFAGVYAVTGGSRQLFPLSANVSEGKLQVTMPSFDTHATLLAIKESTPLVGLKFNGVQRDVAGLISIKPSQSFEVEVTTYNPSSNTLAAGDVSLTLAAGWLQSAGKQKTNAIKAGESYTCTYTIKAPALAGQTTLLPVLVRFDNGDVQSTPSTEMLWWGE